MNLQSFHLSAWLRSAGDPAPLHPRHGPSRQRIETELAELRHGGRRSLRLLDLGCGNGERLIHAAGFARSIGFVAIEGRGVDLSALRIRQARHEARRLRDPGIELRFDMGEVIAALAAEHDAAADLAFLSQPLPYSASALGRALDRVVSGPILVAS
jgi:SAM-dependent methyltransferase